MKRTAIIDGDIPLFTECSVAAGRGNDFGPYFPDINALTDAVCFTINLWAEKAGADDIMLVMSHSSRRNFRKLLLPAEYKAQRAVAKPAGYYEVCDAIKERYNWIAIDGIEGDDTCGILHTSEDTGETVTVSTDKDFRTLPGLHFNPNKMIEPELISVHESLRFWFLQILMGDSADGYKGCKGVGKVKAGRLLEGVDLAFGELKNPSDYARQLYNATLATYIDTYVNPQVAYDNLIMQARMARILHRKDYDKEANTIRLWDPHTPEILDLASF